MNNTNNNDISLLHSIYNEILSLKAGQENFKLEMKTQIKELKLEITTLKNQPETQNTLNQDTSPFLTTILGSNYIHKPAENFCDITLMHIFKMISEDLGIEVTSHVKAILTLTTKLICDDMAAHLLMIALGPNPSWGSIPAAVKKEMYVSHASIMKDSGIDFTGCLGNWASTARVALL
ncbi:hypothetical protein PHYBLDRAFT_151997 [Phycomyces blakesleeanus NRRL 1555(-)]|uniref:Uncharacterized protein n=1 Tax=Phycomyces blakesleeanus (strain ATCC 8743b / DSM 1359 / FGSC 10004 / NBRC 33097 / NRRL 1555) TaxID=763407 RepID=A0A162WGX8_PHYB8|nr:hypothetical protein PHYBLDRAFT_151997 [Phycomyces blakesleeanus NRRL 1555(-)]OAD67055.1 hypothetical protein PHYBLDRAFT_151997 [Phycomyces blakesleeanus NRRL 1555(-)]|eukprot:XP_018285095.1 hypothetical protein PHYBLDRAFT_151997 [Phycomyces blakesleeanus NRRL 1555(-)]